MIFPTIVRFLVYCLVLQSIVPSFAWAYRSQDLGVSYQEQIPDATMLAGFYPTILTEKPKTVSDSTVFDAVREGNAIDTAAGHVEALLPFIRTASQAFQLINGKFDPIAFVSHQLGNIAWSRSSSRQSQSTSQDIPSVVHWGVVNFEGSPALHIKGYMTIDSVGSGSLGALTSEPLVSSQRSESSGEQENNSINPTALSFSWGKNEFKQLKAAVKHANAKLSIGQGKLKAVGDAAQDKAFPKKIFFS